MKTLVVGQGSIGQRHARILHELGHDVGVVSSRDEAKFARFPELDAALRLFEPDYVVVANETALHAATLSKLFQAGYGGLVLVEKPLSAASAELGQVPPRTYVGYNLRFHPLFVRLREILDGRRVHAARVAVGQFLPFMASGDRLPYLLLGIPPPRRRSAARSEPRARLRALALRGLAAADCAGRSLQQPGDR